MMSSEIPRVDVISTRSAHSVERRFRYSQPTAEKRGHQACSVARRSTQANRNLESSISAKRVFRSSLPMRSHMKVRVLRVPPSRALEGIDLRPYKLQKGNVYELEPQVAQVLIMWKYAEPVSGARGRKKPKE